MREIAALLMMICAKVSTQVFWLIEEICIPNPDCYNNCITVRPYKFHPIELTSRTYFYLTGIDVAILLLISAGLFTFNRFRFAVWWFVILQIVYILYTQLFYNRPLFHYHHNPVGFGPVQVVFMFLIFVFVIYSRIKQSKI